MTIDSKTDVNIIITIACYSCSYILNEATILDMGMYIYEHFKLHISLC